MPMNSDCRKGSHAKAGVVLRFRKGEVIFCQGDSVDSWFEVMSGVVRTCHFHTDGHRQLTGFFYEGDVFGVESESHDSAAEAVTSVILRRSYFPDADSEEASSEALSKALDSAHQCIFLLGHRTASGRVAAFLLNASKRISRTDTATLPMSRSDIADHLGLTMHTVSRTISNFVKMGLIRLDGPQHCQLLDRDRLKDIACGHQPAMAVRQPHTIHPDMPRLMGAAS